MIRFYIINDHGQLATGAATAVCLPPRVSCTADALVHAREVVNCSGMKAEWRWKKLELKRIQIGA